MAVIASLAAALALTTSSGADIGRARPAADAAALQDGLIRWRIAHRDNLMPNAIRDRFGMNPDYAADHMAERDALIAAAQAPDDGQARRLAAEGLRLMQRRRARWFTGDDARWLPVDDAGLISGGLQRWMALRRQVPPPQPPADEGLALFLIVDRLLPEWQALVFTGDAPLPAEDLLRRAVAAR